MASISFLPLEVIHHILEYLSPEELITLFQVSPNLGQVAKLNHLWLPHVLEIWKRPVFFDVRTIPQNAWSFSHQQDGWFEAYRTIMRTSTQKWTPDEENVKNTAWAVTFIGMDVIREIPEKPHSIVELRDDMNVYSVGGVPLIQHKWWIANGQLRVPAYPPLSPLRDEYTWGRVLKHIQVLMHSSSPEFLENLLQLNRTILEKASGITLEERSAMKEALESGISGIRAKERDASVTVARLDELHFARRRGLRLAYHIPDEEPEAESMESTTTNYTPELDGMDDFYDYENEMFSDSDFDSADSEDSEDETP